MPALDDAAAPQPAGLIRRLAAMVYDGLVLLAIELLATVLVLPLAQGDAIVAGNDLFRAYLVVVAFLFFGWFWTHGGQTLGMRAWRVTVVDRDGGPVSWGQAAARFGGAILSALPLGLGYLWLLLDRERLTWHDRLSGTRLVYSPRPRP